MNSSSPEDVDDPIDQFALLDYSTILDEFKAENKHHFSTLQTKSATNEQVLLIDELITVTMILRNISFNGFNKFKITGNDLLRDLMFRIVKMIGSHSEKFLYHRKRLCLLKDCLFLLYNMSQELQLRSLEEAFLSFALVASFGPKLTDDPVVIPPANIDRFTYLPYGIDALTKLLVREPHNRSFMKAVLTGDLSNSNFSTIVDDPAADRANTRALITKYLGTSVINDGSLLTRSFQLFLSVIPFDKNSMELSKFASIRTSVVVQSLFGAKLIIDLVNGEDEVARLRILPVTWLLKNSRSILLNLNRSSVSMISESVKNEYIALVVLKALIMINSLLGNCVLLAEQNVLPKPIEEELHKLVHGHRINPDSDITLETLLNPTVDRNVANELVRQFGLLTQLGQLVKP
ncbi:hypothetical protein CANTEDRAFT_115771 [Yamadazyma tenuis ATCC 10573]|uniref:DUF913-domain-containing protein n=3 Tax=Candida tenuis TaxID=2315449 RepID=G3B7R9_CANTC|nr:uncharacterized protein CANTEDRAFT_115771 [Yamadazyma tenuis ATCC 10573]EGV62305.1 hypothetical protein CANTEDRAFT_115771 [Yamadazyma tenuis ATCC 10573]